MVSDASHTVPVAVYDASILFPFHVGHLLTFMATARLVQAHWTREIEAEWVERALRKLPGLSRDSVERRRDAMNRALPDALVSDYEHRLAAIVFPDPRDRHVVAAALECGASIVVTRDKKHFTASSLDRHGLRAIDPDVFLGELLDDLPELVLDGVERARAALGRTKPDRGAYIGIIADTGLPTFADRLRAIIERP